MHRRIKGANFKKAKPDMMAIAKCGRFGVEHEATRELTENETNSLKYFVLERLTTSCVHGQQTASVVRHTNAAGAQGIRRWGAPNSQSRYPQLRSLGRGPTIRLREEFATVEWRPLTSSKYVDRRLMVLTV